jgi:KaiC/GvpD/RAD55 family RecA-like ATPase
MSGGAAIAAAAAAEAKRRSQKEEEQMTAYKNDDLDGWEFKIVRALHRRFKTADSVRQLCAEEAKAGWEMVEKFDDSRIRFKRRIDQRDRDAYLEIDPYRTHIGMTEGVLVILIIGISLAALGLIALIVNLVP